MSDLIYCPNCGALAGEQSAAANDVKTLSEQLAKERDKMKLAIFCLQSDHVQNNKFRMGACGSGDIDDAIKFLKS